MRVRGCGEIVENGREGWREDDRRDTITKE